MGTCTYSAPGGGKRMPRAGVSSAVFRDTGLKVQPGGEVTGQLTRAAAWPGPPLPHLLACPTHLATSCSEPPPPRRDTGAASADSWQRRWAQVKAARTELQAQSRHLVVAIRAACLAVLSTPGPTWQLPACQPLWKARRPAEPPGAHLAQLQLQLPQQHCPVAEVEDHPLLDGAEARALHVHPNPELGWGAGRAEALPQHEDLPGEGLGATSEKSASGACLSRATCSRGAWGRRRC